MPFSQAELNYDCVGRTLRVIEHFVLLQKRRSLTCSGVDDMYHASCTMRHASRAGKQYLVWLGILDTFACAARRLIVEVVHGSWSRFCASISERSKFGFHDRGLCTTPERGLHEMLNRESETAAETQSLLNERQLGEAWTGGPKGRSACSPLSRAVFRYFRCFHVGDLSGVAFAGSTMNNAHGHASRPRGSRESLPVNGSRSRGRDVDLRFKYAGVRYRRCRGGTSIAGQAG